MAIKKKIENTRFPHWCRIYRSGKVNPFGQNGEAVTLYEGECRIYANSSIRIFHDNTDVGRVVNGDLAISIPLTVRDNVQFCDGDGFEARDGNREHHDMVLSDGYVGTMGSTLGFSKVKN